MRRAACIAAAALALAQCAPLAPATAADGDGGTPAVLVMMCVCYPPPAGEERRHCSCRPPTEVPVGPNGITPALAGADSPATARVLPSPDWKPQQ